MSQPVRGHHSDLSSLAHQALRDIVRQCLRVNGLGLRMPEDRAVEAAIELIESGHVRIEYDPIRETYRLEVAE